MMQGLYGLTLCIQEAPKLILLQTDAAISSGSFPSLLYLTRRKNPLVYKEKLINTMNAGLICMFFCGLQFLEVKKILENI